MSEVQPSRSTCECGCHSPLDGVVPSDFYRERAREFVETNKDRYPDLLIEQFAAALNNQTREIVRASYMAEMCVMLFRMLTRAGKLKPETDDERALLAVITNRFEFPARLPAGNRRIASPFLMGEYTQEVAAIVQASLFDLERAA